MANELTRADDGALAWWLWMLDAAKDGMRHDFVRYNKLWSWIYVRITKRDRELRAELEQLRPLAEAAVRLGQTPEPGVAYSLDDITGRVKAERDTLWAARAFAAQAQDGADNDEPSVDETSDIGTGFQLGARL